MLTLGICLTQIKTKRASVIPYVIKDGKIYFLLAVDKPSGDITDLGGGVKKGEFALMAALREFKEETDEIFGKLYDDVNNRLTDIAIVDKKMSVLFLPLPLEWFSKASPVFAKNIDNRKKKSHDEVSSLVWVSEDDFVTIIKKRMWRRIKHFYSKNYSEKLLAALRLRYSRT
ncbi:MAG: NUDIX domain-containing protein [Promethearchaeia archaeon]